MTVAYSYYNFADYRSCSLKSFNKISTDRESHSLSVTAELLVKPICCVTAKMLTSNYQRCSGWDHSRGLALLATGILRSWYWRISLCCFDTDQ